MRDVSFILLLLMLISCRQKETYVFVTEDALEEILLKDPVYLDFKTAQQELIEGIQYRKFNKNRAVTIARQKLSEVRSKEELNEFYQKAGMDEDFQAAFDKWYTAKMEVQEKYKTVIQHQPQLFKKVADANAKAPLPDVEKIKTLYRKENNLQKKETIK